MEAEVCGLYQTEFEQTYTALFQGTKDTDLSAMATHLLWEHGDTLAADVSPAARELLGGLRVKFAGNRELSALLSLEGSIELELDEPESLRIKLHGIGGVVTIPAALLKGVDFFDGFKDFTQISEDSGGAANFKQTRVETLVDWVNYRSRKVLPRSAEDIDTLYAFAHMLQDRSCLRSLGSHYAKLETLAPARLVFLASLPLSSSKERRWLVDLLCKDFWKWSVRPDLGLISQGILFDLLQHDDLLVEETELLDSIERWARGHSQTYPGTSFKELLCGRDVEGQRLLVSALRMGREELREELVVKRQLFTYSELGALLDAIPEKPSKKARFSEAVVGRVITLKDPRGFTVVHWYIPQGQKLVERFLYRGRDAGGVLSPVIRGLGMSDFRLQFFGYGNGVGPYAALSTNCSNRTRTLHVRFKAGWLDWNYRKDPRGTVRGLYHYSNEREDWMKAINRLTGTLHVKAYIKDA